MLNNLKINILTVGICIIAYMSPANLKLQFELWCIRRQNEWIETKIKFYKVRNLIIQNELRKLK